MGKKNTSKNVNNGNKAISLPRRVDFDLSAKEMKSIAPSLSSHRQREQIEADYREWLKERRRMEQLPIQELFAELLNDYQKRPTGSPIDTILCIKNNKAGLWFANVSKKKCTMQFGCFQPERIQIESGWMIQECGKWVQRCFDRAFDVNIIGDTTLSIEPGDIQGTDGTFLLKWIPKAELHEGRSFNFTMMVNGKKYNSYAFVCFRD